MKRRIIVLCLCLCLLMTALPITASADTKVAFISINDTLPPELINHFTYSGGAIYVPAYIFATYGFGIYFSYVAETGIATLYNGSRSLNFDISKGETYDDGGNRYTLSGIMWGGSVYVPISYVAAYFGTFNYSTINTSYGTVLRIKDGRVILTDAEFMKPAMNLLKQYYNLYNKEPEDNGSKPEEKPDEGSQLVGADVMLSFAGLPGEAELELIESLGLKACFFLTAEQIAQNADRLRCIAGRGHRVGILWQGDQESYRETEELLFEAARLTGVLVCSTQTQRESCQLLADEMALVHIRPELEALYTPEEGVSPYVITSGIEIYGGSQGISVLLNCSEGMAPTLEIVFDYLKGNGYDIFSPSEILF